MSNHKCGGAETAFGVIGEPRVGVMTTHVRCAPGPSYRGIGVEGLLTLYLDASDRVVGLNVTVILPSNVSAPDVRDLEPKS